ncbi:MULTISPECIES: class I SAM-dependent methyltransferase [unclassified Sinorhizobium]|uniref:class I SAM-dependent methyltransferase n=1 Tax=unclassified Sinorhizobium TaxID=2613772 RepID=UPI00352404C8
MATEGTSSFYDENAEIYAVRRRTVPTQRLDAFLSELSPGAPVLELGCGGGHDCAYMLSKGFDVMPTDGSVELAKRAEKLLDRPVKVMRFESLDEENEYSGVWAEASLLHMPRAVLPDVLKRINRALKYGGILHASFKAGDAEGYDGFGRYYNYPSVAWLTERLSEGGWRNVSIIERDGGGYDGKPTRWLYLAARK